jgi:ribonuclease HI
MKLTKIEIEALKKVLSNDFFNLVVDKIDKKTSDVLINLNQRLNVDGNISMFIDGAADLNSKTAGIGGVIYTDNEELFTFSEYLHDSTNNEAEYTALIRGLEYLIKMKLLNVDIFSDSELVVKQISGEYKVKNPRMQQLNQKASSLFSKIDEWTFTHVLRDKNKVADKLAGEGRSKGKK